jgi:hypothetical protein
MNGILKPVVYYRVKENLSWRGALHGWLRSYSSTLPSVRAFQFSRKGAKAQSTQGNRETGKID